MRDALVLGLALAFSGQGAVLVSENFNAVTPGTYSSGAIGSFTVTGGSVDVVGGGFFGNLCIGLETTNCVDLSGNAAGTIATNSLSLPAGSYTLTFNLNGSQRNLSTSATVTLGSAFTETFTLASADQNSITRNFIIAAPTTAVLQFQSNTVGNVGALLDNVTLSNNISAVPEPASFLLLSGAGFSLYFLKRKTGK